VGCTLSDGEFDHFAAVIALHTVMLCQARAAIDCWSVVGRRCVVAKDVRVLIAKMAWEEPWRWGATDKEAETDGAVWRAECKEWWALEKWKTRKK
jgi:hypothetical protein